MFTKLPHVGGVVMSDEDVKLSKLSKFILKEMDRRKRLFSTVGISNIVSYRKGTGKILPSILLVVDNTVALYDMYDYMVDDLAQVSREGSNLGIHLVLTANDINGIGYKIVGNIKMVCAIQLTDKADYVNTVGSSYGLYPAEAKGRGLVKGNPALEFQTALVCKGDTEVDRADNLKSLISEVGNSWSGARAKEIPIMPDLVSMEYLIEKAKEFKYDSNNYGVAIGLDSENIEPVYLDMLDTGSFVIAGTSMSGKTNMIKSWITGLAEQLSPDEIEIYVVDSNAYALYALKELPHVKSYISNNDEQVMGMEDFKKEYDRRKELLTQMRMQGAGNNELPDNEKKMVFVVDDVIDFTKNVEDEVKEFWENIIKRERRLGIYIAAAGIAGDIISSYTDILLMAIKEMKSGFLFGAPAEHSILNINLPYSEMSKQLKPGECYFVNKNKVTKLMSGFIE